MIGCGLWYSQKVAEGKTEGPGLYVWSGIIGGFGSLLLRARAAA